MMIESTEPRPHVPARAWAVTFAGTAVNLCLGILYAWSIWKKHLLGTSTHPAGSAMLGLNEGWTYLNDAEATWAYAVCGLTFALCMIPGGWVQDRLGPRTGATVGGLCLAAGCLLAGLLQSYVGLLVGFGLLGGLGMGLGYAAATPAAVKWFGPHQRGLVVGLVVAGYGGAAIYIAPLADFLIEQYGLSASFIGLGLAFAVVVVLAGQLLVPPPAGYMPPADPRFLEARRTVVASRDWSAPAMLRTRQFYALVFVFFGSAQSGLLVIANASTLMKSADADSFLVRHGWMLAAYGGLVNALGRVGTGRYSDYLGRANAYLVNGLASVLTLFLLPTVLDLGNPWLLFAVIGVTYWQYGGGLSLLPAFTADFFGPKNLGLNYGLVFLGWGLAFFVPQMAGYLKDHTGDLTLAFYLSGSLLLSAILVSRLVTRPLAPQETASPPSKHE